MKPYDLESRPKLEQIGHIDFGGKPAPIIHRGFKFMVSLVGTEVFSGNFSVFTASHKSSLEILTKNPDLMSKSGVFEQMVRPYKPFEFIAKPGDVMFFHHVVFHAGNPSHSENRRPRIALACEAYRRR